jgi:hypothetical protein
LTTSSGSAVTDSQLADRKNAEVAIHFRIGVKVLRETLEAKLIRYGERAYVGAWALEILASVLGLTTGIALAYQGYKAADDPNSVSEMDLILASAPYFMVAIAELTKIPIATLLFSVRWIWKPFVFLFLIGLAGITFETVFMGLERAVTLRQTRYDEIVQKIDGFKDEVIQLSARVADTTSEEHLKQAKANLIEITAQAAQDRSSVTAAVSDVEKQIRGQKTLSPAASRLRDQIAAKRTDRDRLQAEQDKAIGVQMEEFEKQRESFRERLELAQKRGDNSSVQRYEDELRRLQNPRVKIEPL